MYSIKNVECFLSGKYGQEIPEEVREGILSRAKEAMAEDGSIDSGKTRYIMGNTFFIQIFEDELSMDFEQLKILGDFAERFFKMKKDDGDEND